MNFKPRSIRLVIQFKSVLLRLFLLNTIDKLDILFTWRTLTTLAGSLLQDISLNSALQVEQLEGHVSYILEPYFVFVATSQYNALQKSRQLQSQKNSKKAGRSETPSSIRKKIAVSPQHPERGRGWIMLPWYHNGRSSFEHISFTNFTNAAMSVLTQKLVKFCSRLAGDVRSEPRHGFLLCKTTRRLQATLETAHAFQGIFSIFKIRQRDSVSSVVQRL